MGGVPSGGSTIKNIIIGVLTTVLAYVIVHFIFDKKSGKEEFQNSKEATESAWNSVNDYINYNNEKFKTIACFSCDEQEMKRELLRELQINSNNLANLKQSKNIDAKMHAVIDRIVLQFADLKPVYNDYYDSLTVIKQRPIEEQTVAASVLQTDVFKKINRIQGRDTVDIDNYLRDVNKKYKTDYKRMVVEGEYKPESLPGKWTIECAFTIDFKADKTLIWTEKGNEFKGRWKLEEVELVDDSYRHALKVNLDTDQEFNYQIVFLNSKMMVVYSEEAKSFLAACPEE